MYAIVMNMLWCIKHYIWIFTRSQFGLRVGRCLRLYSCVRPSVHQFFLAIIHHQFLLGSPNLEHRSVIHWLSSLWFCRMIPRPLHRPDCFTVSNPLHLYWSSLRLTPFPWCQIDVSMSALSTRVNTILFKFAFELNTMITYTVSRCDCFMIRPCAIYRSWQPSVFRCLTSLLLVIDAISFLIINPLRRMKTYRKWVVHLHLIP